MAKEFILDIGIGEGGDYQDRDGEEVIRIGLNKEMQLLRGCQKSKRAELILSNADVCSQTFLPFRDEVFQRIDIILPHDNLMRSLLAPDHKLWQEIARVLSSDGGFKIVVESPKPYQELWTSDDSYIKITDPELKITEAANMSGLFLCIVKQMTPAEFKALGTFYSTRISSLFEQKVYDYDFFKIGAIKRPS